MSAALKWVIYIIGIAIICFGLVSFSATVGIRLLLVVIGLVVMFIPSIVAKSRKGKNLAASNEKE